MLLLMGTLGSRQPLNIISWMTVVAPVNHPKSLRNRCVIVVFGGVIVLLLCLFHSLVKGFLSQG